MSYERLSEQHDRERAIRDWTAKWETLRPLQALDKQLLERVRDFCAAKRITLAALDALGTRVALRRGGQVCLAWAGQNGNGRVTAIKYRPLGTSSHESVAESPSVWLRPIVAGRLDSLDWLIAEGETDAARLVGLVGDDVAVLVLPTGARADFRREWAALVPRGATVYLCHDADVDGDAGARRAALVLGGKTVRLRPPDGCKDWCEFTGSRDDFVEIVRAAREQLAGRLEPLDLGDFLAGEPPPVPWRWRGWLAKGDLAFVVGDPGVGKSLFGLGLAVAVRRGLAFLGETCALGRVALFDFENPETEAHRRLRAFGLSSDEHDGLCYFHAPRLQLPDGLQSLAETLERYQVDLAVIDSLRRAAPGLDENDSAAVSAVFTPLRELTATSGRTIAVLHHARKRIGDNPTDAGQMVRGSGDLVASVDTLLYLRAKEAGAFTLEHGKSRRQMPQEPILVRVAEDEQGGLELVNEGPVALADDKVEAMLARIIAALQADGGALPRQVLSLRIDVDTRDNTFNRALKLGWQREQLAKTEPSKVGEPALYAAVKGQGA